MSETQMSVHGDVLSQKNLWIFTAFLAVLLIPAVVYFGYYVLAIVAVSYGASLTVELLFARFRKKKLDASWMVTPLIFALFMPSTLALWIVAVGASFGTLFAKSLFGGLGKNIFNPAVVGVLFVMISFPQDFMAQWFDPITGETSPMLPIIKLYAQDDFGYTVSQLMFGGTAGAIGETFRAGILIIGAALIWLKIIDWRIPVVFLGTLFIGTVIGQFVAPDTFVDPGSTLLVGGAVFVAVFVATDPVTAPMVSWGKVIYAIGLGFFTLLIRYFAAFPEGVVFAVILMNAIAPLIDTWFESDVATETQNEINTKEEVTT